MQMERERRGGIGGGGYNYGDCYYENGNCDRYSVESVMMEHARENQSPEMLSSFSKVWSASSSPSSSPSLGLGFIEHQVSKMDTLAGVAIKYGVEVADIKRMNGLVTDSQMFALKALQIPLPGRHPPSPCLLNGSETSRQNNDGTPIDSMHRDLLESFQSLKVKPTRRVVSPAMSTLQGYYKLRPEEQGNAPEGFEMAVYQKEAAHYIEDVLFSKHSPSSNPPLSRHRKSRSLANGFMPENGEATDDMTILEARDGDSRWNEKLIRRRQKSEADFSRTPERLLKDENNSIGGFSPITGKGLAMRTKALNRTGTEAEVCLTNPFPVGLGDSIVTDSFAGVRKSSSTSNLQDQEGASFSSIWPSSMWNLKPDLQALSTAAITRPIYDGLPKPVASRKNKAALD